MSLVMAAEPTAGAVAQGRRRDPDLVLVAALRSRESTAAELLVASYGDRAYRLALGITGNREDAEEVVQDACWSVVRKIDSFRGDSSFGSWFYRIVANGACAKIRRAQSRRHEISWDDVPSFAERGHVPASVDWSTRVDDPAVQSELREALTAAIAELPEAYRTVLVLRDVNGLSTDEVAEALGLNVPNVKTRVHRARLFLRKRLDQMMTSAARPVAGGSRDPSASRPPRRAGEIQGDPS